MDGTRDECEAVLDEREKDVDEFNNGKKTSAN